MSNNSQLTYRVIDTSLNSETRRGLVKEQLERLGIELFKKESDAPADIVIIHDENEEPELIEANENLIVIRYTGGPTTDWLVKIPHYISHCSFRELLKRLGKIHQVTSLDELWDNLLNPTVELKFLPALAILCQGYLAVHASVEGEELNDALDHMGLGNVTLREEVRSSLSSDLANRIDEVNDVKWWSCVFGNDDWEEQLKLELGGNNKLPESIQTLSDFITGQPVESRLSRNVVSKAYLDLVNELE